MPYIVVYNLNLWFYLQLWNSQNKRCMEKNGFIVPVPYHCSTRELEQKALVSLCTHLALASKTSDLHHSLSAMEPAHAITMPLHSVSGYRRQTEDANSANPSQKLWKLAMSATESADVKSVSDLMSHHLSSQVVEISEVKWGNYLWFCWNFP